MNFISFVKKYKKLFILALLIVVLILIGKFISTVHFVLLRTYLTEMPGMFAGVILASFLAYLAPTFAWKLIMGKEHKGVRFIDLFMIKHIGEILTAFNPTGVIAGETVKAVYLNKRGVQYKHALSSIIMLRILIILSGIFLVVISGVYLIVVKAGDRSNLLYILIAVALIVFLSYLLTIFLLNPKLYLGKTVEKIKRKTNWSFLSDKIVTSSYEINQLSSDFFAANKIRFTSAFLLSLSQWVFGALEFYIILQMLGFEVSMVDAVAVEMGVIFFRTLGAVIPGQIGIEEYGNKVMLNAVGIQSNEVWLVATIMRRGRQVFWLGVAAIFTFFITKSGKIKLSEAKSDVIQDS